MRNCANVILLSVISVSCFFQTVAAGEIETTPTPIKLIEPGTVIPDGPPKDWQHLVIKTRPRIADDDLPRVSNMTARMASLLTTAFCCRVETEMSAGEVHYRVGDIAVGLCVRIEDRDVVIDLDTQRKLGANLGFLERTVLSIADDRQRRGVILAKSNSLAIVDTFAMMQFDKRNRAVSFRYFLLLDERTGKLDRFVCLVDRPSGEGDDITVGNLQWLSANKVAEPLLYMDDNELTLGIPSNQAFAVKNPPAGEVEFPVPPDMMPTIGQRKFSPADVVRVEQFLRARQTQLGIKERKQPRS